MPEIEVASIQVGGFRYSVEAGSDAARDCRRETRYGSCDNVELVIRIDSKWGECRTSETIIHEMLEAVVYIYLNGELKHKDLSLIANGLHQVMESLGVRFTAKLLETEVEAERKEHDSHK